MEQWRTSSFTDTVQCVKVRRDLGAIGDSKDPNPTAILTVGRDALRRLVDRLR